MASTHLDIEAFDPLDFAVVEKRVMARYYAWGNPGYYRDNWWTGRLFETFFEPDIEAEFRAQAGSLTPEIDAAVISWLTGLKPSPSILSTLEEKSPWLAPKTAAAQFTRQSAGPLSWIKIAAPIGL